MRTTRRPSRPAGRRFSTSGSARPPDVGRLQALGPLAHVELDPLVLLEAPEPRLLNGTEVNEHIRAVLLGDEAVALLRVEPLHNTSCHLQFPFCNLLNSPRRSERELQCELRSSPRAHTVPSETEAARVCPGVHRRAQYLSGGGLRGGGRGPPRPASRTPRRRPRRCSARTPTRGW